MQNSLKLYLEINNTNYIFVVTKSDNQENFKIAYKLVIPFKGIADNRITDYKNAYYIIKENIFNIEKALKHTFKEVVLIVDNLSPTFINLSGYKKLNGTQIQKENITYILNNLKSYVEINESRKTILHIFNTKFNLDNKKIDNLPIGLFGDFYSHELSFTLINANDYKNIKNIFDRSGLKIKKVLIKNFIKGAYINDIHKDYETFFQIRLNKNNSKIFYFENNSFKFEQTFEFGTEIIVKDIFKITSLKEEKIKLILRELEINHEKNGHELIDEKFFENEPLRKIKKKLIYDIAFARIEEIADLLIFKNINLKNYIKFSKVLFLEIDSEPEPLGLGKAFQTIFSKNGQFDLKFINCLSSTNLVNTANKLVQFGWNKEVIPITQTKKSLIGRFFEAIFS